MVSSLRLCEAKPKAKKPIFKIGNEMRYDRERLDMSWDGCGSLKTSHVNRANGGGAHSEVWVLLF